MSFEKIQLIVGLFVIVIMGVWSHYQDVIDSIDFAGDIDETIY